RAPEFEAWLQRVGVTGAQGQLLSAPRQPALPNSLWTLPQRA
ncbi:MAG: ethanolamine ammonia-lyase large subunit, partial [Hydrogenophaga sp.]